MMKCFVSNAQEKMNIAFSNAALAASWPLLEVVRSLGPHLDVLTSLSQF